MEAEDLNAWNPAYREAVKEILDTSANVTYTTQNDIALARVADLEKWRPSEEILELVPHFENIEIELITFQTDLNDANKRMIEDEQVGLVLMGPVINRKAKPYLILIVTSCKIYAIDPDDTKRGIQFLKMKLKDKRIKFCTTNGVNESDCLYHIYGINLMKSNSVCCTGLHVYMMKTIFNWPNPRRRKFPPAAMMLCTSRSRLESFENLVEIWLDIDKSDLYYSHNQLAHLKTRPLSNTAINLILKRCLLVLPLYRALDHDSISDIRAISTEFYTKLLTASPDVEKIAREMLKSKRIDCLFYYLDGSR